MITTINEFRKVYENNSIDYSEAYYKMDKYMPEESQDEYWDIIDDESLTVDEKVDELEAFLDNNADYEIFLRYSKGGNFADFARYIIDNDAVDVENTLENIINFNINDVKENNALYNEILSLGYVDVTSELQRRRGVLEVESTTEYKWPTFGNNESTTKIKYTIYPNGKLRKTTSQNQSISFDIMKPIETEEELNILLAKAIKSINRIKDIPVQ